MQYLFNAIMGIIQGLTEFLPVSSSGHLLLGEKLLGLLGYESGNSLSLAVMLHMGTLVAVAIIFFRDWLEMIKHPVKNPTLRLLFIASLPALVLVVLLGDWIDGLFTGWFLGIRFLITALFLFIIQRVSEKNAPRPAVQDAVDTPKAITMGLFQGIALLPGVSRSGSTLLGGVLSGLSRRTAAKFSFMMSAPAILGSFVMEGKDAIEQGGLSSLFTAPVLIGALFAAVSGWLAIRYMLKLIERISFYKFAAYVAIVGIAVIIMQLTGFAGFPPLSLPGAVTPPLG